MKQRSQDQKVDSFSAPKSLIDMAISEAIRRRLTKSGFYRYCLAKELGFSEAEAMVFAEHIGLSNALSSLAHNRARHAQENQGGKIAEVDTIEPKQTTPNQPPENL